MDVDAILCVHYFLCTHLKLKIWLPAYNRLGVIPHKI